MIYFINDLVFANEVSSPYASFKPTFNGRDQHTVFVLISNSFANGAHKFVIREMLLSDHYPPSIQLTHDILSVAHLPKTFLVMANHIQLTSCNSCALRWTQIEPGFLKQLMCP